MTLSYTAEVATCRGFGCFLKLLLRWRGSIYKMVWMDLLVFLSLYYTLSFIYRFSLDEAQMETFENIVRYCNNYGSLIPLSFVLGFYVAIVMNRWWTQYLTIPWPDPIAVYISSLVHGQDERGRVMRRTVMRYVCLCLTMVLASMSPRVKKRFPTKDHLVDAGLLLESEKLVIENIDQRFPKHPKHWMPIVWSASIIKRARKEGRIRDDFSVKTIIEELNKFRGSCGQLMHYDVISIPLVYTQVVTLAVYSYFLCNIMGKQWTQKPDQEGYYNMVDKYFPLFTTLEFFFYVGWLKVAESLINPFGNDDDDFEVNWLVDRNLQVSYLIVDEMHHEHPELIKDQYWDAVPNELPYANEGDGKREKPPEPSTARLDMKTGHSNSKLDGLFRGCSGHNLSSCPTSVSRLNNTLKSFKSRQDDAHKGFSNSSSFFSMGSSKQKQSSLIAIVKPSPKQVSMKSSEHEHTTDNSGTAHTLVNQPSNAQTRDVREVFRQVPSTVNWASTSAESIRNAQDSASGSEQGAPKDDFERLKQERVRQRLQRQKDNLVLTVGSIEDAAAIVPLVPIPPILSATTQHGVTEDNTHVSSESEEEKNVKKLNEEKQNNDTKE